jgi:hypothetical protein
VPKPNPDAAAVCAAIDELLDGVADYHTIIRPTKVDFAKLEALHAETARVAKALGISLPPIDEAGLQVFVEFPVPGGSYHTGWRQESIFSPERHDRWRRKVRESRRLAEQAAAEQTGGPQGRQSVGFDTTWPFGMLANLAERKVRRGDTEADFGSNKPAWQALVKLARNYPRRTSAEALWEDGTTELGSVYTAVSTLRRLLAPLGVDIPHPGRRGYVLAELPQDLNQI